MLDFAKSICPPNWNIFTNEKHYISRVNILNIKLLIKNRTNPHDSNMNGVTFPIACGENREWFTSIILWKPVSWVNTMVHELAHIAFDRWLCSKFRVQYCCNSFLKSDTNKFHKNIRIRSDKIRKYFSAKSLMDLVSSDINHGRSFQVFYELMADRVCKRYCKEFTFNGNLSCPDKLDCDNYLLNSYQEYGWLFHIGRNRRVA